MTCNLFQTSNHARNLYIVLFFLNAYLYSINFLKRFFASSCNIRSVNYFKLVITRGTSVEDPWTCNFLFSALIFIIVLLIAFWFPLLSAEYTWHVKGCRERETAFHVLMPNIRSVRYYYILTLPGSSRLQPLRAAVPSTTIKSSSTLGSKRRKNVSKVNVDSARPFQRKWSPETALAIYFNWISKHDEGFRPHRSPLWWVCVYCSTGCIGDFQRDSFRHSTFNSWSLRIRISSNQLKFQNTAASGLAAQQASALPLGDVIASLCPEALNKLEANTVLNAALDAANDVDVGEYKFREFQ